MEAALNKPTWNNSFLFNIPEIDEQHKTLFDVYDKLLSLNGNYSEKNSIEIKKIFQELYDYIKYHFQTEEALLEKIGWGKIEEHKKEHQLFIKKLKECSMAYEYQNAALVGNMVSFVKKWLVTHILHSDAEYKDQVNSYMIENRVN